MISEVGASPLSFSKKGTWEYGNQQSFIQGGYALRSNSLSYIPFLTEEMHLLIACVQPNDILGEHNKWK